MNSKINNVDYNQISSTFISDEKLSLIIQQNISFVEKYIDVVENSFKNDLEKQIVYRELGSIVFSCIEALLKSVLVEINNRCERSGCVEEKCPYRKYNTVSKINRGRPIEVLKFLLNIRLLGLTPPQIDEITRLNDLRNYVHISKNIAEDKKDDSFDKKYVENLLFYYYELLDQLDLADFYFKDKNACLKLLDDDGIKSTEIQIQSESKTYYLLKVHFVIDKLFNNKTLTDNDKWILKIISDDKNININELIDYIYKETIYSRRRFKNEKEFDSAKDLFLDKILKLIKNNGLKERIVDVLGSVSY